MSASGGGSEDPDLSEPDLDAMVAALLGEPFCMRLVDLAELTDRQIFTLYYHPRDKEGRVKVGDPMASARLKDAGAGDEVSEEEARGIHFGMCAMLRMSIEEAERSWREVAAKKFPKGGE